MLGKINNYGERKCDSYKQASTPEPKTVQNPILFTKIFVFGQCSQS